MTVARAGAPGSRVTTLLVGGIFLVALTAALRLGAGFLLPIAIAGLFTLLLDPAVRMLRRAGLPTAVGAALVVSGAVGATASGAMLLAGPAAAWIDDAPATLSRVEEKLRRLFRPLAETAERVDRAAAATDPGGGPTVQVRRPGILRQVTGGTARFVATALTVVFLTYSLLAMLPTFRAKVASLIGTRAGARDMEEVLNEIELQMSRYVMINTLTSAGVGVATGGVLALVGLPNAILWGLVAFLLNYIPYAGALVTVALVGAAALAHFDGTGEALLVAGACAAINLAEGNLVTPWLLGKHLPLNPVAIFVSLLYWGWVWGPAGALLAVPITVMVQVIAARIERLRPLAVLLDS